MSFRKRVRYSSGTVTVSAARSSVTAVKVCFAAGSILTSRRRFARLHPDNPQALGRRASAGPGGGNVIPDTVYHRRSRLQS
jgi:hypothetical protein